MLRTAEALRHTLWVTPYARRGALAVRPVPEPVDARRGLPAWTAADRLDRGHRRRALVRLRHPPHHAHGGLADHARGHGLVLAEAVRLLRPQPDARRAAVRAVREPVIGRRRACRPGRPRTARSRTPTSCSGTCSASTTSRAMEDWPIMPVDTVSFWLKPFGFFDRNPTLDLPPSPSHCDLGRGDGQREGQRLGVGARAQHLGRRRSTA